MTSDLLNSVFESVGAALVWRSAYKLWKSDVKATEGRVVIWWSLVWAFEGIVYYFSLGQTISAAAAFVRLCGLLVWTALSVGGV